MLFVLLGLPPGHSAGFNFSWSVQYSDAWSWSDPFPRHLPGLWSGLGGQDFFFYAPLPFWFTAVFVDPLCVNCAPSTRFVLGTSLVLVASGFAMFAFLRAHFERRPAAFGAVIYTIAPYHLLIDWFERQAAGEFTAYAFLPLVALGVEKLRRQDGGGAILALGVAGLALSHLPTTLLAGHVFAILVLIFVAQHPGPWRARLALLLRLAGFAVLGLALASFYWLPAVMLLDTVSPDTLFDPFFTPSRWLYGTSGPQPDPIFAARILVGFAACLPLLVAGLRHARGPVLAWILVPSVFAVAMNTPLSMPVWNNWVIAVVQFPWRLMTVVDFATGIAAAVLAARVMTGLARRTFAICLLAFGGSAVFLATTTSLTLRPATAEASYPARFGALEYLSPEMTAVLRTRLGQPQIDHFDQAAVFATLGAVAAEVASLDSAARIVDQRPRAITVLPPPGAEVLTLPVQYWSFWTATTATGTSLEVRANPTFGTIDVIAPPGGFAPGPVTVSLPFHLTEVAGGVASLLSLLVLIGLAILRRRQTA